MALSRARAAAFEILLRVEQEDAYASELLHAARWATLSRADHGLTTEIVMGVLRWRSRLDDRIKTHSSQALSKLDLEVLTALRIGAYQLLFLDRVPQRAAVHESVELVKRARKTSAAPFVNAVLRKIASGKRDNSEAAHSTKSAPELAAAAAHPEWMVQRWIKQFGLEVAQAICQSDQQKPPAAVRFSQAGAKATLENQGVRLGTGKLISSAYRVESGDVSRTAAFREHAVSIQDEGSQLVALLVGHGERILDCCAAPGGKTLAIHEQNPDSSILAVELHEHRARALRERLSKTNIEVRAGDIAAVPGSSDFDRILADVPCSGTGTLARNPEIKWRLRESDILRLQEAQLQILKAALKHVSPAGRIVYSTCSLEREENEEVVERVLRESPHFRLRDCRSDLERMHDEGLLVWNDLNSLLNGPYLRTIPGVHPCDGFFAAIVERR